MATRPGAAQARATTYASYQTQITTHVVPGLGSVELQRLSPAQLNAFYRRLLAGGRRDGQGLAPKTVKNIHAILHRALKDAVRWGYVVRNVADAVEPPKGRSPEMRVWTPEQLRAFLANARTDRLYAAWLLVATTGMRRGELAGLRWIDLDLDAGRASPRRPRVVVNYAVEVSEPKTAKGRRSVALDALTVAALREHKERQAEDRAVVGPGWRDSGLVFTRPDGAGAAGGAARAAGVCGSARPGPKPEVGAGGQGGDRPWTGPVDRGPGRQRLGGAPGGGWRQDRLVHAEAATTANGSGRWRPTAAGQDP